jgi:hypothetical protein
MMLHLEIAGLLSSLRLPFGLCILRWLSILLINNRVIQVLNPVLVLGISLLKVLLAELILARRLSL